MKRIAIGIETTTAAAAHLVYHCWINSFSSMLYRRSDTVQYLSCGPTTTRTNTKSSHGARNASSEIRWFREPLGRCNRAGQDSRTGFEPGFRLKKHAVLTQKRPILTPFQRENRKIQGVGQKRKVQQTLEFTGLFWRSGWDSNPRTLADQTISNRSRYDHFDTTPCMSNTVRTPWTSKKRKNQNVRTAC